MRLFSRKKFADGSVLRYSTRESLRYVDPKGRAIEIIVHYVPKGRSYDPQAYPNDLKVWHEPAGEQIVDAERVDIIEKLKRYLGKDRLRLDYS